MSFIYAPLVLIQRGAIGAEYPVNFVIFHISYYSFFAPSHVLGNDCPKILEDMYVVACFLV